jgi:hypothetical protein
VPIVCPFPVGVPSATLSGDRVGLLRLHIDHEYRVTGKRILPDSTSNPFPEVFERLIYKGFGGGHGIPVEPNREWFYSPEVDENLFFRPGNFEAEELAV